MPFGAKKLVQKFLFDNCCETCQICHYCRMGRLGRRLALMLFLIGGITFVFALIRYREWLLHRPLDWWVAIFTIFGSVAALAGLMPRGDRRGIARFLRRPQPPTADEIATASMAELQRKLVEAPSGPDEPLPVIVRAGAWRPKRQPLLDWLAQQLATDYGWLPVSHARALIARGIVLPILDGLDEMPTGQQRAAIARINKHHIYRPLILTSREREFVRAIAGHGPGRLDRGSQRSQCRRRARQSADAVSRPRRIHRQEPGKPDPYRQQVGDREAPSAGVRPGGLPGRPQEG